MSNYHKLYTPQDSAVAFIDHQPLMTFGVANIDRATLINNVTLLAKVAKEFGVPAVISAAETVSFSGYVWPQLLDVFPGQPVPQSAQRPQIVPTKVSGDGHAPARSITPAAPSHR